MNTPNMPNADESQKPIFVRVGLPPNVHRAIKIHCAAHDTNMSAVLSAIATNVVLSGEIGLTPSSSTAKLARVVAAAEAQVSTKVWAVEATRVGAFEVRMRGGDEVLTYHVPEAAVDARASVLETVISRELDRLAHFPAGSCGHGVVSGLCSECCMAYDPVREPDCSCASV